MNEDYELGPILAEDAGETVRFAPGTVLDPEQIEEEYVNSFIE